MNCGRCGMYVYVGNEHEINMVGGVVDVVDTGVPAPEHVCPEPFPRETAEYLLSFLSGSGMPTTSRIKARIKLGLES